jgi:hypothetical protein
MYFCWINFCIGLTLTSKMRHWSTHTKIEGKTNLGGVLNCDPFPFEVNWLPTMAAIWYFAILVDFLQLAMPFLVATMQPTTVDQGQSPSCGRIWTFVLDYVFPPCKTDQNYVGTPWHPLLEEYWLVPWTNHQQDKSCRMLTTALSPLHKLLQWKLWAGASFAIGPKKGVSLILDCFQGATSLQPFWNKRIVSAVWVNIINSSRYDVSDDLKFSHRELNAAVSRNKLYKSSDLEMTAIANPMGLYKAWFKTRKDNKQCTIVTYYATTPNTLTTVPGGNSKWVYGMVSVAPQATTTQSMTTCRLPPEEVVGSMPT